MFSKRDIIIFLAGVEAFHAVSHALLYFSGLLPLHLFFMTLTPQLNIFALVANVIIALGLLWWASKIQ